MRRALWIAMLAGAMGAGGCAPEGTIELGWQFVPLMDGGEPETAAAGCGNHGVDSVMFIGSSDAGDGGTIVALCTKGTVRRSVPPGRWSFRVHTLDIQGKFVRPRDQPDAMTDALAVGEDAVAMFPIVTITPRPRCGDTVDNDRDGRIDADDPDCAGDPAGNGEPVVP
jgi:hypothetical protein